MEFRRLIKMSSKDDKIKYLSIEISVVRVNLKDDLLDDNGLVDIYILYNYVWWLRIRFIL